MKLQRHSTLFVLSALFLAVLLLPTIPAGGANKDMIQLQTQMQQMQDQMARMQQSFDERMGVMKNLVEQNTDAANKATTAIVGLQTALDKQQADSSAKVDQVSGQIQALNDTLDELKTRLAKVSKQLEDMQAAQQNLNAQPGQTQGQMAPPPVQAPPPDVLYNNALRDYNGGKSDIAAQEFGDYIKYYSNTDLAGNSYFYLAEIQYKQGNFQQAVQNYDQVLQNFPGGNKAASAELKKGMALIQLGQKEAGITALKHVVQRYPRTNEALQAKDQLRRLGVMTTASKPSAAR